MTAAALRAANAPATLHPTDLPKRPQRHLTAVSPLPDAAEQIPDPSRSFVLGLAAKAFEIVEGCRGIAQLGGAITVGASRQLLLQRSALQERRAIYRQGRSRLVGAGGVRLFRVQPQIAEASVVLHAEHRSHAVAIRLEWAHSRWRACELFAL